MKVKATVTIEVTYEEGANVNYIDNTLTYAVNHLVANGLLSGVDDSAEVDTWSFTIRTD